MSRSDPPKVVVRDLRKSYGGIAAVRGVSFTVAPGEIFGLLGPNGAGKTTTLECLVGLREPDHGQVEVCGINARLHPREAKQWFGVALQTSSVPDKATPREVIRLFGSFYRQHSAPDLLLERFGLTEKAEAYVDTLSGGQRQRLALALAFVNQPEVVLLDEPTTGLDPQARRELHASIARMKADGYTVLLTTHYLDEAEDLCDRVAIIDRGTIVAAGAPRELVAASRTTQTVTLRTTPLLGVEQLQALPAVEEVDSAAGSLSFRTNDANATLGALTRLLREERVELLELHVRKASLEEVFLALTREERT